MASSKAWLMRPSGLAKKREEVQTLLVEGTLIKVENASIGSNIRTPG